MTDCGWLFKYSLFRTWSHPRGTPHQPGLERQPEAQKQGCFQLIFSSSISIDWIERHGCINLLFILNWRIPTLHPKNGLLIYHCVSLQRRCPKERVYSEEQGSLWKMSLPMTTLMRKRKLVKGGLRRGMRWESGKKQVTSSPSNEMSRWKEKKLRV